MGICREKKAQNGILPMINHDRFSNSRYSSKEDTSFVEINVLVASQQQFIVWSNNLKQVAKCDWLFLPTAYSFVKECYCGQTGFVKIIFPTFQFILPDQIKNRHNLNRYFDENQIWYITWALIAAAYEVHSRNQKIGDIRPENMFINEIGVLKIGSTYSWPNEKNNYQKRFLQNQTTYLAPEQIKDIQSKKFQSETNFRLAETFSIGLTLLDTCTLSNSQSLYVNNQFQQSALQTKLDKLSQIGYPEIIQALIINLCSVNPIQRESISEIYNWLKPHSQIIIGFLKFQFNEPPKKINTVYQLLKDKAKQNPQKKKTLIQEANDRKNQIQENETRAAQQVSAIMRRKEISPMILQKWEYPNWNNRGQLIQHPRKIDESLEKSKRVFDQ